MMFKLQKKTLVYTEAYSAVQQFPKNRKNCYLKILHFSQSFCFIIAITKKCKNFVKKICKNFSKKKQKLCKKQKIMQKFHEKNCKNFVKKIGNYAKKIKISQKIQNF